MSGFEVQWIRFEREVEKDEERVVDVTWSDRVYETEVGTRLLTLLLQLDDHL